MIYARWEGSTLHLFVAIAVYFHGLLGSRTFLHALLISQTLTVEWQDGKPIPTLTTLPVYPQDTLKGRLLDALGHGESVDEAITHEVEGREVDIRTTALRAAFGIIREYDDPIKAMDCLCFAVGESLSRGETIPKLASRYGKSKQAIQQEVDRISEYLQLRKASTMQSLEARENMRKSNFRKVRL